MRQLPLLSLTTATALIIAGCSSSTASLGSVQPSAPAGLTTLLDSIYFEVSETLAYAEPRIIKRQMPAGSYGNHPVPELTRLSTSEEREFLATIQGLPSLPAYSYSGCNDRAHALWLMLPDRMRAYTAKVWLLGPQVLTLSINDPITIRSQGDSSPRWGYHVALVYLSQQGIKVLDPTHPAWSSEPLDIDAWISAYEFPHATIMSIIKPESYIYFAPGINLTGNEDTDRIKKAAVSDLDQYSNNTLASVANNGNFMTCTPGSSCYNDQWIERSLARDEVALMSRSSAVCDYISSQFSNPGRLLERLLAPDPSQVTPCALALDTFRDRRKYWNSVLRASH